MRCLIVIDVAYVSKLGMSCGGYRDCSFVDGAECIVCSRTENVIGAVFNALLLYRRRYTG